MPGVGRPLDADELVGQPDRRGPAAAIATTHDERAERERRRRRSAGRRRATGWLTGGGEQRRGGEPDREHDHGQQQRRSAPSRATSSRSRAARGRATPPDVSVTRGADRRAEPVEEQRARTAPPRRRRRAARPTAAGRTLTAPPTCSRAACSVLRSRQAIVIGPTPPGHRRDRARDLDRPRRSRRRRTSAVVGAVHADVDDRRAGLDPVAADHPRAADGGDQDVGAAADRGEVARARVARRDRRVGREQQLRHRLAEEVRAADHDRLGALERRRRPPRAAASRPSACTAAAPRGRARAAPALSGVRPSTSFSGSTRPVSSTPSRWSGTGQLAEDAADLAVGVELLDQRDRPPRAARRRRAVVEAPDADLGAGLLLAADVDGARRIVADEDRREARRAAVLGRERLDLLGDLGAHARGDRP